MEQNKRVGVRATTKIEILFKEYGAFVKVYMLNVSNGGLFVKTETPLPLDSPVILKLKLPGEEDMIEIEGRVIWINPKGRKNSFPKGMGIQFEKMSKESEKRIKQFVSKYQKEIQSHSIM